MPPLLFPANVPRWSIAAALPGLALTFAAGHLLVKRFVARTPLDLPILLLLCLLPTSLGHAYLFNRLTLRA